jgi:hypothetical protein
MSLESCIDYTDQYVCYGNSRLWPDLGHKMLQIGRFSRDHGNRRACQEGFTGSTQKASIRGLPVASGLVPGVAARGGRSPCFGRIASSRPRASRSFSHSGYTYSSSGHTNQYVRSPDEASSRTFSSSAGMATIDSDPGFFGRRLGGVQNLLCRRQRHR